MKEMIYNNSKQKVHSINDAPTKILNTFPRFLIHRGFYIQSLAHLLLLKEEYNPITYVDICNVVY